MYYVKMCEKHWSLLQVHSNVQQLPIILPMEGDIFLTSPGLAICKNLFLRELMHGVGSSRDAEDPL